MYDLIYGIHAIQSMLDNHPKQILCVYVMCRHKDKRVKLLIEQIKKNKINIYECNRKKINYQAGHDSHQGIIAKINRYSYMRENNLSNFLMQCKTPPLLLVLDRITDPHNLGACLRSAGAAGVHIVIVPRNHSVNINATVRKVASGAADHVPFMPVTNLSRTLKLLQKHDICVIGTEITSKRFVFDTNLIGPLAFVMGSEGYGMRRLTKKNCNALISIPMMGLTKSLNVSVATGICLFEALRQRKLYKEFL
ncbi:23S rRNA (guanosine(2251)-2'-O)-methyltransferase RlmB [Candidatus Blochmannia ocreatus (nom. nud.)]|uniref:23S rRNA (guanosine-2'-O-)-methyltransferase RlmB n=1 Tax=Candidatus Blochmannia ocreatus (nom. nud.) TaxID=251538 RepID=A0ABY4ST60_9ENTR|nr:23S rRNA (guanosine(2251)-2'-O)-methyltransferase RlmB [Candidatus Blochmannia ocreatus]URJ25169.1 23S rRNA (guanosine(2251)-2'-O)-methyltransferase RlmB [Candidatus Blochmannia ocreatus]